MRAFGRDLAKLPARQLASYRTGTLGYADQHYGLMLASELTAHDLVTTPLALRGEPRGARDRRADELLERVGLLERRGAHPTELSGGEQQRIAVCAALAHRPRLFLADEPTGELDAENARRLFELIGDLVREREDDDGARQPRSRRGDRGRSGGDDPRRPRGGGGRPRPTRAAATRSSSGAAAGSGCPRSTCAGPAS